MSTTIPGPYNSPYAPYHSGSLSSTTIIESDPIYVSDSGSLATLGSNTFVGTQTFTGDLVPTVSSSFSLGTSDNPWKSIFISSGSLSLQSDVPGGPDAVISNKLGNLEVSVGGMQLLGNASFRAATGSFTYISGSMTQVGNVTTTGASIISGSLSLSSGSALNINDEFYVNGNKQFNYGAFSSTITQSGSANTAHSMSFDTTDVGGYGVTITNGTRITVANTGIYNLQFSAQLDRINAGTNIATIWFAYTGSSIANSATDVTIAGSAASNPVIAAWNYILPMSSGSYAEIYWSHDDNVDNKVELKAVSTRSNPTRPAVPSIIASLTQIA